MGDFTYGRDNGLWGEDGVPYDISDNLDDEFDTWETENNLYYSKYDFPGMRDTGNVKTTFSYTLAEYEHHGFRLEPIAKRIKNAVGKHFILYDYKGTIRSDSPTAINIIRSLYTDSVHLDDEDILHISDVLLAIIPTGSEQDFKEPSNSHNSTLLWHMQLHPNDVQWNKERELLEKHSLIGLGQNKSDNAYTDFKRINKNDIVLIKSGAKPIALVQVTGDVEEIESNKDEYLHLDWFKYRRKVKVLDYAHNKMDPFPQPRGTLSLALDENTRTYQYIDNWYSSITQKIDNPIVIPPLCQDCCHPLRSSINLI